MHRADLSNTGAGAEGAQGLAVEGHRRLKQGLSFAPCNSDSNGIKAGCPRLQRHCCVPGTSPVLSGARLCVACPNPGRDSRTLHKSLFRPQLSRL